MASKPPPTDPFPNKFSEPITSYKKDRNNDRVLMKYLDLNTKACDMETSKTKKIENNQDPKTPFTSQRIIYPERDELDKIFAVLSVQFAKLRVDFSTLLEVINRKKAIFANESIVFLDKHAPTFMSRARERREKLFPKQKGVDKECSEEKPLTLSSFSRWKEALFGNRSKGPKMSGRAMKYPYTHAAKIAQFPYRHYFTNNWMYKYYLIAVGVSFPLFYKIGRMSNSPENVKKWEEIRRRDFGGHHH